MEYRPFKVYLSSADLLGAIPDTFTLSNTVDADIFISDRLDVEIPKSTFRVYACESKPSFWSDDIKNAFDAWIIKGDGEAFANLVKDNFATVSRVADAKATQTALCKAMLYEDVTRSNCEMIKDHLHHSVVGIRDIFQEQVRVMREIHEDIKETKLNLQTVRDTDDALQKESLLDESIGSTQDILTQADQVINAMYGFVSILQCEDRLSQIIDGMNRALSECVDTAKELGAKLEPEMEQAFRQNLVRHYTIQEQRDFAMGLDVKMHYCEATPSLDDSEPLFF